MKDLRERYVYSVVRHLPYHRQEEVAQELDARINRLLDESQGATNLETVLRRLGDPADLALQYCNSDRKALISGIYYLMYKRVLILVLPIVAAIVGTVSVIGMVSGQFALEGMSLQLFSVNATTAVRGVRFIAAGVGVITGIACAVCAVAIFGQGDLVNPDFVYHITALTQEHLTDVPMVGNVFIRPQTIALTVMLIVIFFEVLDLVVKAVKARR